MGFLTKVRKRLSGTPRAALLIATMLTAVVFYVGIKTGGFSIPINRLP